MGILIKNNDTRANYSGSGLGQYVSLATTKANLFIANGGITVTKQQTAIKNFYTGLMGKGIYDLLSFGHLMNFGLALPDSLDIINPTTGAATKGTFINDATSGHTSQGFVGNNTASRYLNNNVAPSAGTITNLHLHAYNVIADSGATSHLMGAVGGGASGGTGDYKTYLSRGYAGSTVFSLGSAASFPAVRSAVGYNLNNTGLISGSYQSGTTLKLYDGGALIASSTAAITPTGGGNPLSIYVGGGIQISSSPLVFVGGGFGNWSDQNEADLNTLLNSFVTDMT